MSVQFEWQAGSDDGQWETISRTGQGPGRRRFGWVPWWAWIVVSLVFVGLAVLGYWNLRRRYDELRRQAEFQIQSVIDLEARAFARGDADLFLDQQDRDAAEWYAQQVRRIGERCSESLEGADVAREVCTPVQPARVQSLDLHGDLAWVIVVEGKLPVRKARFYRQTDLGWRRTAPRVEFWKTAIRVQYGELFVQYHKRDTPQVVFLEELIATTYANVCATTLCPAVNTLTVDFSLDTPVYQFPYLIADPDHDGRDRLVLSSPWLSGMPLAGEWSQETREQLTHAVAYATMARAMRSTTKRELSPLREAVADEYAAWFAGAETEGLALLGPIIEQRGEQVVPALLGSAKESRSSAQFLDRWLGLSLSDSEMDTDRARLYFEALLNLERQALVAGREKTFLMVQDTEWRSLQGRYFRSAHSVPRTQVRVKGVQVKEGHARVQLEEPLPSFRGQPPQSLSNVVYFRVEDGDWRHTSVMDAYFWALQPLPTATAGALSPSPTPRPAPSSGS